jgi:hypothetical protein
MHITITLPHPLARLNRILVALERARAGADPHASEEEALLDRPAAPAGGTPSEYRCDMEFLSLSRAEASPTRRSDDLDFLSLSKIEGTYPDHRDSLSDLSLERNFPPRSGS